MDPTSCFKLRNGEEISFVEYYKKVCICACIEHINIIPPCHAHSKQNYQYEILDRAQPLLLSQPKERDVRARGGDDSPILLVPELCTRTGQLLPYVWKYWHYNLTILFKNGMIKFRRYFKFGS